MTVAAVFFGGALGAITRALIAQADPVDGFAWATLLINVIGCLAIGLLAGRLTRRPAPPSWWQPFWATGFLGGFTTMSAYAVHTWLLHTGGQQTLALVYACSTLVGSVAAAAVGYQLGQRRAA